MRANKEWHNVDHVDPVTGTKSMRAAPPKLRKNKRLDKRWGQKYYATVKEAVFTMRATPYMPPEPPPSLRDETDDCQPLYVCKQCRDCFRFLSSLEAHTSRRSWILGFWCHRCFFTDCSHSQSDQLPCFDCQTMNRQQKTISRYKGLRKGRKMGSVKIFYNQCQFFAHLKEHQTTFVDMADIMLMPMPTDADRECYAELERLCETIMERMFLTCAHIMDWLKLQQLGNKWWSALRSRCENSGDSLAKILADARITNSGKKSEKYFTKPRKTAVIGPGSPVVPSRGSSSVPYPSRCCTPSSISATIEAVVAQSVLCETATSTETTNPGIPPVSSVTFINPMEPIEDDDDPCTTTDIAFVDCGPAAKTYPPDVAILLPPKDKLRLIPNGATGCSSIVNVMPVRTDPHPSVRVPRLPLKMEQHQADNVAETVLPSIASPASHCLFEPKISVKKFAIERLNTPAAIPCQKNYSTSNNQRPQTLRKLAPASKVRISRTKSLLSSGMEITRAVETAKKAVAQTSVSSLRPRILTVQSPRNADLSKIISQLPADVIDGKKLIFIGQDAERFTILPKNEAITSDVGMIKIQAEPDKAKIIQTLPTKVAPVAVSDIESEENLRIASETSEREPIMDKTKPKAQQIYLDGKIIFQNGKKFFIRQARKAIPETNFCNNSNHLKLQTVPKRVSLSSFLSKSAYPLTSYIPIVARPTDLGANKTSSFLTPSFIASPPTSPSSTPSPSLSPCPAIPEDLKSSTSKEQMKQIGNDSITAEKSTVSPNSFQSQSVARNCLRTPPICNIHYSDTIEYFSIQTDPAGRSYVDFSKAKPRPAKANKGLSWTQVAMNYKQQMLENFRRLGEGKFKEQIDHLTDINSEYSKILGVTDNVRISDNLKAIEELQNALNELPLCSDQDRGIDRGSCEDNVTGILLNSEETEEPPSTCPTCNKRAKPNSRILDFSKNPGCCNCNNYVCHICDVFQGNMSRFGAHLNFHAKREPFTCPECFRKFPTFHKLETHIWTTCFHSLAKRWFKCRVCQVEGFLDMDSLTKHFILAHSKLKIACPECGILLKSQAAFQKHREEDHPRLTNVLKPVNLIACDVGNCVVRLENYRSHMDDHVGVIKMLYYKCSLCSFLINETERGRERMKYHLHNSHSGQLSELISSESLPDVVPVENLQQMKYQLSSKHLDRSKRSFASEDDFQSDHNRETHDVLMSDLHSEKNDQGKNLTESEQSSDVSESMPKNTDEITSQSFTDNSQTGHQSPSDYLDATLTKQMLRDGVECSVWSINLDHPELPESADMEPDSLEIMTTVQRAGSTPNNVITEYSSSPKIFDVRSVTPDSYAELGRVTKEQVGSVATRDNGTFQSVSGTSNEVVVSVGETKDSLRIRTGEQMPSMKLPEVIVIDQAEATVNLSEMLQSTLGASSTFVQLSDIRKSDDRTAMENIVELLTEPIDRRIEPPQAKESSLPVISTVYTLAHSPQPEQCKKITVDSTTSTKLPGLVAVQPKQSVCGEKSAQSVSLLKSKNSRIRQTRNDATESSDRVSHSQTLVPNASQVTTNTSGCPEEKANDFLLCDIPRPPPLARIPLRLLEKPQLKSVIEEEEPKEAKVTATRSTVKPRRRRRRPWRIALNAPIGSIEIINYNCHLCGELVNTSWSVLSSHFSSRHSQDYKLSIITPRLLQMSSDFISVGYKEVLGSKKRKSDGSVSTSKRRRRWNPKKHIEKHPLGPGLCVQQESVQDREGNFVCKKCDQRCNDISSLRTHIGTNHRIKDHYLVCLECGENFVVEPSLQMHLKAFHRIQDVCTYMAHNPGYAKEITETIEDESNTGIANQCHVCMAVFEDKLAVDKHLRVHGMAFLNRKRMEAQNAARNPETKSKIDKPDECSLAVGVLNNKNLESHQLEKAKTVNGETVGKSQGVRIEKDKLAITCVQR